MASPQRGKFFGQQVSIDKGITPQQLLRGSKSHGCLLSSPITTTFLAMDLTTREIHYPFRNGSCTPENWEMLAACQLSSKELQNRLSILSLGSDPGLTDDTMTASFNSDHSSDTDTIFDEYNNFHSSSPNLSSEDLWDLWTVDKEAPIPEIPAEYKKTKTYSAPTILPVPPSPFTKANLPSNLHGNFNKQSEPPTLQRSHAFRAPCKTPLDPESQRPKTPARPPPPPPLYSAFPTPPPSKPLPDPPRSIYRQQSNHQFPPPQRIQTPQHITWPLRTDSRSRAYTLPNNVRPQPRTHSQSLPPKPTPLTPFHPIKAQTNSWTPTPLQRPKTAHAPSPPRHPFSPLTNKPLPSHPLQPRHYPHSAPTSPYSLSYTPDEDPGLKSAFDWDDVSLTEESDTKKGFSLGLCKISIGVGGHGRSKSHGHDSKGSFGKKFKFRGLFGKKEKGGGA